MPRQPRDNFDDGNESWRGEGNSPDQAASQGFAGSWSRTRPSFDSPMSWSLPLFRAAGIDVRIHLLFLVFVAWRVLDAALPAASGASVRLGITYVLIEVVVVFTIVLLHEFGHSLTCRRWGGSSDEILMWPLGGLAYCAPPHAWKAHLATAIGGPAVNVLILCITVPAVGLITGKWLGGALPNPFVLDPPSQIRDSYAFFVLFAFHWTSLILLLFNLIPLYPLDGGRITQALLWPRFGYAKAVRYSCRFGFVGAIGLLLVGALNQNMTLIAIAFFGGVTCVRTLQQLSYTEEMLGYEDSQGAAIAASARNEFPTEAPEESPAARSAREREEKKRAKEAEAAAREAAEFDRILEKISASGIQSLSAAEKRVLERETERRRRGG